MNWKLGSLTAAAALVLVAGCSPSGSAGGGNDAGGQKLSGTIEVDGSSTVYPITEAVAEEFQRKYSGVNVTVGVSGTGGGFKKFAAGETAISNASRPIKESEAKASDFIELPVAYDAIAIVVNPKNTWAQDITPAELKKLWEPAAQGKITRWNQIRASWPDRPIKLYGPGSDSGTFDYFTDAIVGEEGASRGDYTASEDDNVLVQGVSADENALGYFGLAYYLENEGKVKAVPVDDQDPSNGEGAQAPTAENVKAGTYQPLSRPIFIYVSTQKAGAPEVTEFVKFYLEQAPALVEEVGYVPLEPEVYELAKQRFESKITGSMFEGGSQVGVKLTEVMQSQKAE
ncbi:MAG: PstS family phosphate ABC transporter substrate-binding protein [Armatimonadota bacterium]